MLLVRVGRGTYNQHRPKKIPSGDLVKAYSHNIQPYMDVFLTSIHTPNARFPTSPPTPTPSHHSGSRKPDNKRTPHHPPHSGEILPYPPLGILFRKLRHVYPYVPQITFPQLSVVRFVTFPGVSLPPQCGEHDAVVAADAGGPGAAGEPAAPPHHLCPRL